eukprot:CAMPEP_0170549768 /NCGR_PEP_ID=MMETSP0211-20121228/7919_1 /TAXON_ID=311385 /ORGANISM="Pseudokeronopsis sp., Strain OXSARD2" /LENGTH=45 /DNA_ID= /DNA_START= /DNA_END= /DNA_ORIENTATION=
MELKKKIFDIPKFLIERMNQGPVSEFQFKEFNLSTEERFKDKENV